MGPHLYHAKIEYQFVITVVHNSEFIPELIKTHRFRYVISQRLTPTSNT